MRKSEPTKISLSLISSLSEVASNDWDACALDATGPASSNPFLSHGFLSSLEEAGCAVKVRPLPHPFSFSSDLANKKCCLHVTFSKNLFWIRIGFYTYSVSDY